MTEFRGKRVGYFRGKPICKVGKKCPRCGSSSHVGTTTCIIKRLSEKQEKESK